jgi:transposase
MEKVIKKYNLKSDRQEKDDRRYWQSRPIKEKLETVEALRQDAIKLGIYPDYHENKQGLRRVLQVIKQK